MTETREQFRERIGRFAADWDGGDWEMMMPEDREMYASQAAAVYAECLRDVLEEFGRTVLPDNGLLADEIHAWAYNQMGVDLTDEMKAMFPDAYDNNKGAQS